MLLGREVAADGLDGGAIGLTRGLPAEATHSTMSQPSAACANAATSPGPVRPGLSISNAAGRPSWVSL